MRITDPLTLEKAINNIVGVVTNGLFAMRLGRCAAVGHSSRGERDCGEIIFRSY